MLKAALHFFYGFISLCLISHVESMESLCTLKDAPQQCGAFCLAALNPLFDDSENNRQQWKETTSKLDQIHNENQAQLDRIEAQLAGIQEGLTKVKCSQETEKGAEAKIVSTKFERIGSRYFYIDNNETQYWLNAKQSCKQMGGDLASFKNEDEINTISKKLTENVYWIIYSPISSVDSGKPDQLMRVYNLDMTRNTDYIHIAYANTWHHKANFICQAGDVIWHNKVNI